MSDNQKKLNEQLLNVVLSDKDSEEAKLKKVKYLVRLGADVNQKVNGKNLLRIAREKGYKEIENVIKESLMKSFEKLLEGDKFDRVLDECGYANEHKVVVSKEKAINLGEKFWKRNGDLKSAKEIEVLILQGADVNVENKYGETALMSASKKGGDKEVAELLVENGADVNIEDNCGDTALTDASYGGYKEVVEMLLQNGADVNHKDVDGETALMNASKQGHKEVVEMLLQNGADVNIKNDLGTTALMMAAEKGYKDVVEVLLEGGADVNQKDDDGWTALIWAANEGQKEVVEMLLQNGADVNQKDNWGNTALMNATDKETKKVIKEHIKKTGGEPTNGGFLGKIIGGFGR